MSNITPLTAQQVFDNALFGIRRQGYLASKSISDSPRCLYRSEAGLKCGIGHSIPDELYHPEMDWSDIRGGSVERVLNEFPHLRPVFGAVSVALLVRIQTTHDSYLRDRDDSGRSLFEEEMRRAAREFGVRYTPPEESNDA